MSAFTDALEEALGEATDSFDITAMVRRCWFYDFAGYPTRIWQGQGRLFTADGKKWLGSVDERGTDHHEAPAISDGRDGASPEYTFGIGSLDEETYRALQTDRQLVSGRSLTCYLAIFGVGEGLRPAAPLEFFARLTMQSPIFEESLEMDDSGVLVKRYKASVIAKDGNAGLSRAPMRTYTDTSQKFYARMLGVDNDRACEFVAGLSNKTFLIQ
jgi:hypothetical protein